MAVLDPAPGHSPGEPLADPELDLVQALAHDRGSRITTRRLLVALAPLAFLVVLFTGALASLVV